MKRQVLEQLETEQASKGLPPVSHRQEEHVAIYLLVGHHALHPDARIVRQLIEAIALSKGVESPRHTIQSEWLPYLRRLAEARKAGASWGEALEHAGLTKPNVYQETIKLDQEITALRQSLSELIALLLSRLGAYGQRDLLEKLELLLSDDHTA